MTTSSVSRTFSKDTTVLLVPSTKSQLNDAYWFCRDLVARRATNAALMLNRTEVLDRLRATIVQPKPPHEEVIFKGDGAPDIDWAIARYAEACYQAYAVQHDMRYMESGEDDEDRSVATRLQRILELTNALRSDELCVYRDAHPVYDPLERYTVDIQACLLPLGIRGAWRLNGQKLERKGETEAIATLSCEWSHLQRFSVVVPDFHWVPLLDDFVADSKLHDRLQQAIGPAETYMHSADRIAAEKHVHVDALRLALAVEAAKRRSAP